jgi:putative cardiolipin synthase
LLAATDVGAVHAGYAKRREELLRSGVHIYELKPDPLPDATPEKSDSKGGVGSSTGGASSGASLHAKTFSIDRSRAFVGSFNFDPRSYNLNTELGVVIDSPKLADSISATLDQDLAHSAYQVLLKDRGGLEWVERTDQGEVRYDKEPGTGFWKRFGVSFMSILPIEWLL